MKRILMLFCFLLIKHFSFGQVTKLGILLGPNLSTFNQADYGGTPSGILGFHVGVFTEVTLGSTIIETGLQYASIGGSYNSTDIHGAGGSNTTTHTVQYLQLPVNFIYNFPDSNVFFGAGPYIGFGVSGKTETNIVASSFSEPPITENTVTNYTFSKANNPDYGLNILLGVHLKTGILFALGYGLGIKNNVGSISVGFSIL